MQPKLYLGILLSIIGAMMTSAFPADPRDMKAKSKGIIGNPAEVFTDLFTSLSNIALDKISEIRVPIGKSSQDTDRSLKLKRDESDEDASDEEGIDEVESENESIETDSSASELESSDGSESESEDEIEKKFAKEIIGQIVEVAKNTKDLAQNLTKKSNDDETLEEVEMRLQEIEAKIKESLKEIVLDADDNGATELFSQEFESLKKDFLKAIEDLSSKMTKFTQAMKTDSRSKKSENKLDDTSLVAEIDMKLKEIDDDIKKNLNLDLFEHHRFHRTKASFIKHYKETKIEFVKKLDKIAKEVDEFTREVMSKSNRDRQMANRKEESLLFRNDQSLF